MNDGKIYRYCRILVIFVENALLLTVIKIHDKLYLLILQQGECNAR